MVLNEEPTVASLDNGLGVRLDFRRNSKNFTNLAVKCALFAVKDVTVRVGRLVTVVYELAVDADFVVVASDELEETKHSSLVYLAVDKR